MKKLCIASGFVFLLLASCIDISISELRSEKPFSVEIAENVTLSSWGPVKFFNFDFLPASFCIETGGKTIYIDPLLVEPDKPADYIFITHDHIDHLHKPTLEKITNEQTLIICPHKTEKQLDGFRTQSVHPGESLDFEFFHCRTLPSHSLGLSTHPKKAGYLGYVFTIGGTKIFHPGDSDYLPEMNALHNITVALVPIDGGNLTMKTDEAADLVNVLKPKIAIPMHYKLGKGNAQEFALLIRDGVQIITVNDD